MDRLQRKRRLEAKSHVGEEGGLRFEAWSLVGLQGKRIVRKGNDKEGRNKSIARVFKY